MARRFYVISYDVVDDRRRDRLYRLLLDHGDRVQYSVFCCQLNPRERVRLIADIRERIHAKEDQTLVLDAGPVDGAHPTPELTWIGQPYRPMARCQIV